MDLDLPDRGGFDAALYIREQARHPARPWIIGTTIHREPEDYDRAMQVGMNDFLLKTGQSDALLRALEYARRSVDAKGALPTSLA